MTTDDHLPADGQQCEVCQEPGHLVCWDNPGVESVAFEMFTQVHDVIEGAA